MKTKCNNCKKFDQAGMGSPGRNSGYCKHFGAEKLPYFVNKNHRVRQDTGEDCDAFEPKNTNE